MKIKTHKVFTHYFFFKQCFIAVKHLNAMIQNLNNPMPNDSLIVRNNVTFQVITDYLNHAQFQNSSELI